MYDVIAARALHVLAVVVWIGGVSLVTTVALPALRHGDFGADRVQAFQALERRFAWQARIAVIVVGLTGLYMLWRLSLWDRFRTAGFWWMHAMVCLWALFALILFVAEPIIARRRLRRASAGAQALPSARVERTLTLMQRVHAVLLVLSIVTVLGAVAGSHGWSIF
ncbi:MAG: hypothetical protein ACRETK_01965 [Steroidobacteraceae bacterium]